VRPDAHEDVLNRVQKAYIFNAEIGKLEPTSAAVPPNAGKSVSIASSTP
jgi:hypothetical protein